MIRTYLRSADSSDLRATVPPGMTIRRNLLRGTLPLAACLFGLTYLLSRSLWIAGVLGASLLAASILSNVRLVGGEVSRRASQKANPGSVEVIEVEASRVWDIEHLGSHGPAFLFFAADGRALLLIGQWQLEQPVFPALSFRVHRWSDTGEPIRIETRGPEITPERSAVRVPSSARVRDIELLETTPETLQRDWTTRSRNRTYSRGEGVSMFCLVGLRC